MQISKHFSPQFLVAALLFCLAPLCLAACEGAIAGNGQGAQGVSSSEQDADVPSSEAAEENRDEDDAEDKVSMDAGIESDAAIESDTAIKTGEVNEWDAAIECVPSCADKVCGKDGCGGTCGSCTAAQVCSGGACVCKPDCAGKTCGGDGCGGTCGSCNALQQYCSKTKQCVACESDKCGVCDEIDISTIVSFSGSLGIDHGKKPLTAKVLTSWPITSELKVAFPASAGIFSAFTLAHFPGQSWSTYTGGTTEGAGMVACWDKVGTGIYCLAWDWWTMLSGGYKSFDWPKGRPVAHMFFSAADKKRTAIKYFKSWPHNNPQSGYNGNTVGTGLVKRTCK